MLIFSETYYYKNIFGVSESSQTDATLFKFDSNNNFEWLISIDLLNYIEQASGIIEFSKTAYISFNSKTNYICLAAIEITNGNLNNSICLLAADSVVKGGSGRFIIFLVSPKYIFARDLYLDFAGNNCLLVFDTNSLELIKVLSVFNLKYLYAFYIEGHQNSYVFINKIQIGYRKI